jgi:hypothetical protein
VSDRCVHDFLPGQCAVCAKQELVAPESRPSVPEGVSFPAKFEGWCNSCNGPIARGELIERDAQGPGYVHVGRM